METMLMLLVGGVLLYIGGESLVRGSSALATRFGLPPLVIGLTVVAFGTSAPEFVVSLQAAVNGESNIAVGNVIGSNICNIGLILGLSAMVYPVAAHYRVIQREIPILLLVTLLCLFCLRDSTLSNTEGLFLIFILLLYVSLQIRTALKEASSSDVIVDAPSGHLFYDLVKIVVGLCLLIFGGRIFVQSAVSIATALGVSTAVIGLTVVAIGTSLPELATSIIAALKKESDIAIGNVVGSNIFNILGVLGGSAVFTSLGLGEVTIVDLCAMLIFAVLLLPLSQTEKRVDRREGLLLLLLYLSYTTYLIT